MIKDRSKSPKQKQLLDTAHYLFMRHGISRVTVEEICRDAKVSKMTFYKYFDNKIDIALAVLNRLMSAAQKEYRNIMTEDRPYSWKFRQIIKMKMRISEQMSTEMMRDFFGGKYPEIQEFLTKKLGQTTKWFIQDFVTAQEKGGARKDVKPEFVSYFLNLMMEMVKDEKLLQLYGSTQELTSELINFFFYGILSLAEEEKD
jgi:AcrR family transcriptional regulator